MDIYIESQIIIKTAAEWAADLTVYTKRILVTSDEYYTSTVFPKFKFADGASDWGNIDYFSDVKQLLDTHEANTSNPHNVTKAQVGLANANNTSDANKPVSIAQQAALDLKLNIADYVQHFKGLFVSVVALETAYPTADVGDYAQVDPGSGTNLQTYSWDEDEGWVLSNADGSGANNTDQLPEGSTNLYFTTARAIAAAPAETAATIAAIHHAATAKATPVDADEISGQDSANSFSLIRVTFLNVYNYIKAKTDLVYQAIITSATWGAFIGALTTKTTPVDADQFSIMDSEAANVAKKLSFANLKTFLFTAWASFTTTLTNKRVTKRVVSVTQAAVPVYNTDNGDVFKILALAQAITSMTTNMTGTPTDCQPIRFKIKDNGTARAITWGASFAASGTLALPTTTVINVVLSVSFEWDADLSLWVITSV